MANPVAPAMELVKQIVHEESAIAGIDPALVFGPAQHNTIVWARTRAIIRLRALGYSLNGIGRRFNRHHTTILCSLRKPLAETPPPPSRDLLIFTGQIKPGEHRKPSASKPALIPFPGQTLGQHGWSRRVNG